MFITQLPKPLLFGIIGVIGCIIGWAFGEPLLHLVPRPPSAAAEGAAPAAAPVLIGDNQVFTDPHLRHLEETGAIQKGDIRIGLTWHNVNDLDLHCIDPSGEEIFYKHKASRSGGVLDLDCNASNPLVTEAAEHIVWPQAGYPDGTYRVFVHHYAEHGGNDPTDFNVQILVAGQHIPALAGSLSNGQNSEIRTFEMRAPPIAPVTSVSAPSQTSVPPLVLAL